MIAAYEQDQNDYEW